MSDRWLEIYEDFYTATLEVDPPAPVIAVMTAMCKKIAALEAERDIARSQAANLEKSCDDAIAAVTTLEAELAAVDASAKECPDCGAFYPHHQTDCDLWCRADELAELRAVVDAAREFLDTSSTVFDFAVDAEVFFGNELLTETWNTRGLALKEALAATEAKSDE